MATAFVTGATGFTGGRLCETLLACGVRVRARVRDENEVSVREGVARTADGYRSRGLL